MYIYIYIFFFIFNSNITVASYTINFSCRNFILSLYSFRTTWRRDTHGESRTFAEFTKICQFASFLTPSSASGMKGRERDLLHHACMIRQTNDTNRKPASFLVCACVFMACQFWPEKKRQDLAGVRSFLSLSLSLSLFHTRIRNKREHSDREDRNPNIWYIADSSANHACHSVRPMANKKRKIVRDD